MFHNYFCSNRNGDYNDGSIILLVMKAKSVVLSIRWLKINGNQRGCLLVLFIKMDTTYINHVGFNNLLRHNTFVSFQGLGLNSPVSVRCYKEANANRYCFTCGLYLNRCYKTITARLTSCTFKDWLLFN